MRAIEGKNVILRAVTDGTNVYKPFACATALSFYSDEEQVETTTFESGRYRSYDGGLNTWGFTLSTVTHVAPVTVMITVFDVLMETLRRQGMNVEASFVDSEGNLKTLTGFCRIPHIGISSPVVGFSEDEIEFLGSGPLTIGTVLNTTPEIEGDVKEYEYFGIGGETSISYADFIGRVFLGVWRGYPLDKITTGSPDETQVKVDPAAGALHFASTAPLQTNEFIQILYK